MARNINFFDGAASGTVPTIGNIVASDLVSYADDATFEANEQGSPNTGNIYFNTTINQVRYYNGTGWHTIADTDSTQTFTGKSVDGLTNTLTNLDGDEVIVDAISGLTATDAQAAFAEHQGDIEALDTRVTANEGNISDLETLSGAPGAVDLGTFTGTTIPDNTTVKGALQSLETEVETKIPSAEKGAVNGVATLDAGGKIPSSQLPSTVMEYKGVWDASTNTPTLADGVGDTGDVYRTSVAGTQDLGSGSQTFAVGDWVVYNGTIWEKSQNSDAVASVNGFTGVVVLDTDDVAEGSTNLYHTATRAKTAAVVNSTTGGETDQAPSVSSVRALVDNPDVDVITASHQTTPANPASGNIKVYAKNDDKLYKLNSSGIEVEIGTGAGGGSGGINYITNGDAETDTSGWTAYANTTPGVSPDDFGGTPSGNVTWTRNTTTPLRGTGDFKLSKTASNEQGQGWHYGFTLSPADFSRPMTLTLDAKTTAAYVDGDIRFYVLTSNDAWTSVNTKIEPTPVELLAGSGAGRFEFQTHASDTSYRLCVHVASTNASAYDVNFDTIVLGPTSFAYGAQSTSTTTYTPLVVALGGTIAAHTVTGRWWRYGDRLRAKIELAFTGTGTWSDPTFTLPDNLQIDTSKMPSTQAEQPLGFGSLLDTGLNSYGIFKVQYNTTNRVLLRYRNPANNISTSVTQAVPFTWGVGDKMFVEFDVPIKGWAAQVQVSESADPRVVAASVTLSGTQTVSSTGETTVQLNTVDFDTHAGMNTGTYTYVIPSSGYYNVNFGIVFNNLTADDRVVVRLKKDGATFVQTDVQKTTTVPYGAVSKLIYCNAGDGITASVDSTADASYEILSTVSLTFLDIQKIQGPAQIAASEKVHASCTIDTGQSIPNTGTHIINFGTVDFDSHGAITTGAGWRFTAPRSDFYIFNTRAEYDFLSYNAFNSTSLAGYKNGSIHRMIDYDGGKQTVTTSMVLYVGGSVGVWLNKGDYYDIRTSNNRGAGASTLRYPGNFCWVDVQSQGGVTS